MKTTNSVEKKNSARLLCTLYCFCVVCMLCTSIKHVDSSSNDSSTYLIKIEESSCDLQNGSLNIS